MNPFKVNQAVKVTRGQHAGAFGRIDVIHVVGPNRILVVLADGRRVYKHEGQLVGRA